MRDLTIYCKKEKDFPSGACFPGEVLLIDMFPNREKNHSMITRHEEQFCVDFAHTRRLMKSAIPHMQRILNKGEKQTNKRKFVDDIVEIKTKKRKPG